VTESLFSTTTFAPIHSPPDRLAASKRNTHASQREYRFVFGMRAEVFDFDDVEGSLLELMAGGGAICVRRQRQRVWGFRGRTTT
jgi:hypothetical protein